MVGVIFYLISFLANNFIIIIYINAYNNYFSFLLSRFSFLISHFLFTISFLILNIDNNNNNNNNNSNSNNKYLWAMLFFI